METGADFEASFCDNAVLVLALVSGAAVTVDRDPNSDVPVVDDDEIDLAASRCDDDDDEEAVAAAEDRPAPDESMDIIALPIVPLGCSTLVLRAAPPLSRPPEERGAVSVSDFICRHRSSSSARLSFPACIASITTLGILIMY